MPSNTQSRVLCVDDDEDACEMLSVLMKAYDILGGVGFIEEHPISLYTRGMVPIVTLLGSAQSCNEAVADTVRKGHWF